MLKWNAILDIFIMQAILKLHVLPNVSLIKPKILSLAYVQLARLHVRSVALLQPIAQPAKPVTSIHQILHA